MNKKLRVLVDFSWLYSRSKFAFAGLTHTVDGVVFATGSIHGVQDTIVGIIETYGSDIDIVLCMDGTPKKHQALAKSYKAGRDGYATEGVVDISKWDLAKVISLLPQVRICYHEWMEADETIGFLVRTKAEDDVVLVFSNDGDLRQFIDSGRGVFCTNSFERGKGFVFEDEEHLWKHGIKDLAGLRPDAVALHLAICGDSSDGISGIPRFIRSVSKSISNICLTLDGLRDFVNNAQRNVTDAKVLKGMVQIKEYWKQVELNWGLTYIDPSYIPGFVRVSGVDLEWFLGYGCVRAYNDFKSLLYASGSNSGE